MIRANQESFVIVVYSAWRLSKFMFGKVFSLSNITVPIKFLASLLFGFRYLTKEERANERLLRDAWNDTDASFSSISSSSLHKAAGRRSKSKTWQLIKRGRLLGLSKMLVKSLIFTIAGVLATMIFRFINKRKAMQLKQMVEEEEQKEKDLLQKEWDRIELSKQPVLEITPVGAHQ